MEKLSRYSLPLFYSNILGGALNQIFNFMLPFYASKSTIGNYSAATSFTVLIGFFLTPLTTAMFPLFSKINKDDEVLDFIVKNIVRYETMLIFPIASGIIIFSDHLVSILYGGSYPQTPLFIKLQIIIFYIVGIGGRGALGTLLNSQKETRISLNSTIVFILIGAPLGFLLIPRYSVAGLQITIFVASLSKSLYILWWVSRNYEISLDYESLIKISFSCLFASIISIILIQILHSIVFLELLIGGVVLVVSYMGGVLVTGALNKKNIRDIKGLLSDRMGDFELVNAFFKFLENLARDE
jgi:O-antigen/teichoic acid export membrane protein